MSASIDEVDARHIFRTASGHVEDSPGNRALLVNAFKPANFLGTGRFGNAWYAERLDDGRQVWILCRGNRIRNGGVNPVARVFHPLTGLSASEV